MNAIKKPRVKICCISSAEEAQTAIHFGASALGLVGHMPSGPGIIGDELIAEIAALVPPPVSTFLLTSETKAAGIIAHYKKVNTRPYKSLMSWKSAPTGRSGMNYQM